MRDAEGAGPGSGSILRSAWVRWAAVAVIAVATIAGLVVTALGILTPVSFGWFAYQPLSGDVLAGSGVVVVSTLTLVGVAILAPALLAAAFLAGFWVAFRRAAVR